MRNRPWKNTNTAIELTSLLDVIFIVLMIVVCNQQINTKNQIQEAQEAMVEAEVLSADAEAREAVLEAREENLAKREAEAEAMVAAEADVLAERDFYKEQLDTYENMADQILAVTVFVDYDPADIKNREIRYLYGTKEESIKVNPENMNDAYTELERKLGEIVFANKDIPVIITVSRGQILYRDEKAVSDVLTKLSESHTNLFRK